METRLWNEPVHECCREQAGWKPDVSVSRTPVESLGVDEVGCGESCQPRSDEADASSEAERIGSQALSRQFATDQPGEASHTSVVGHDIQNREGDNDSTRLWNIVTIAACPADGHNQLTETTDDQGACQEAAAATPSWHDIDAYQDCSNTHRSENDAVLESWRDWKPQVSTQSQRWCIQ